MKRFNESKLSVVTPVYKNAETLERLAEAVFQAARPLFADVEYLFVNDASPDRSRETLELLSKRDKKVKVLNLARNFGQHAALMAGLGRATGDYVFFIDGDLEEDPAALADFAAKLTEGYEIAVGRRMNDRSGVLKALTARAYTAVHNALADHKIVGNTTNMRLMTRRYAQYLLEFTESPYISGFTSWIGLPIGFVPVAWKNQRRRSAYGWKKLLRHARAGIVGFSTKLIRMSFYLGFAISGLAFLYALYIIARFFLHGYVAPGFASIVVLLSFFMGLQFVFIGILGEYVAEIFLAVKRRPAVLVYDTFNL